MQRITTNGYVSKRETGDSPLRICHVIPGTGVGGAQMMLHKLIVCLDPRHFENHVISLSDCGLVGDAIRSLGVPVDELRAFRSKRLKPWRFATLTQLLRAYRPHVVQTWIYYADLVGGLAAKLAGRLPVVWNIRHSTLDPRTEPARIRLTARICALLSRRLPHRILLNSNSARQTHIRFGYDAAKTEVIPNGFDLSEFRPSAGARCRVRQSLGLSRSTRLVGLVARFHADKGHATFVEAAASVASSHPDLHFALCGRGVEWHNDELADLIRRSGMADRFHLLGPRSDVATLQSSFDVAVSSSISEGFANVIGEAMACGVPCVVTDVGDSAEIVGDTGCVTPTRDAHALAEGIHQLLTLGEDERRLLGQQARRRILDHFEIGRIAERYARVWRAAASKAARRDSMAKAA